MYIICSADCPFPFRLQHQFPQFLLFVCIRKKQSILGRSFSPPSSWLVDCYSEIELWQHQQQTFQERLTVVQRNHENFVGLDFYTGLSWIFWAKREPRSGLWSRNGKRQCTVQLPILQRKHATQTITRAAPIFFSCHPRVPDSKG